MSDRLGFNYDVIVDIRHLASQEIIFGINFFEHNFDRVLQNITWEEDAF